MYTDISELLLNQAEVNAELETESVEYSDSKDDLEELWNDLTFFRWSAST